MNSLELEKGIYKAAVIVKRVFEWLDTSMEDFSEQIRQYFELDHFRMKSSGTKSTSSNRFRSTMFNYSGKKMKICCDVILGENNTVQNKMHHPYIAWQILHGSSRLKRIDDDLLDFRLLPFSEYEDQQYKYFPSWKYKNDANIHIFRTDDERLSYLVFYTLLSEMDNIKSNDNSFMALFFQILENLVKQKFFEPAEVVKYTIPFTVGDNSDFICKLEGI